MTPTFCTLVTSLKRATNSPDADLPSAIKHIYEGGFLDLIPADITLAEQTPVWSQ